MGVQAKQRSRLLRCGSLAAVVAFIVQTLTPGKPIVLSGPKLFVAFPDVKRESCHAADSQRWERVVHRFLGEYVPAWNGS